MSNIEKKTCRNYIHITIWALILSVFWLLLSGMYNPLLLSFGMTSIVVVLIVLRRMENADKKRQQVGTGLRLIRYIPWLIAQVLKSSIHVTKLIWGSPNKVSPTLAKINISNVPPNKRVLYANSITLTPGTLCVDLKGDELTIHALQKSSITELEEGYMENKITSIWGKSE
jgi:multicomponent Na+:H+ antiporter subunit E